LGSGDGRVVYLTATLGGEAFGVEHSIGLADGSINAGKILEDSKTVPVGKAKVVQGDFLSDDVDLGGYDIIFFFDGGTVERRRLEAKLVEQMREDAILVCYHQKQPFTSLKYLRKKPARLFGQEEGKTAIYVRK